MASSLKNKAFSLSSWKTEEDNVSMNMFDNMRAKMREKIVLQRLIVIARLPRHLADRKEVGAYYERLNSQLTKQYRMDPMTGLLLIYSSCVLHIIESSWDVLLAVLKDLKEMQQQQEDTLLEDPKVLFMDHHPESRLFQQWSHKVLSAEQTVRDTGPKRLEEEEEGDTETLFCSVMSALQKLSENVDIPKKIIPGSVHDETPELIVSQKVLEKLLDRDEVLTLKQYLELYDSPLHIDMDFGQIVRSSCLTTV
ncbi:LOW QUALITY PROTEIN: testis-expressed protein 47 [Xyrichtys novacula]|nr:LOW QUALITY PROTEIN: testis-expressed protein 47 [Xyrichtys novacula]